MVQLSREEIKAVADEVIAQTKGDIHKIVESELVRAMEFLKNEIFKAKQDLRIEINASKAANKTDLQNLQKKLDHDLWTIESKIKSQVTADVIREVKRNSPFVW